MEFIGLSVLCSVLVSVLLKLSTRLQWDIRQVIGGGYLVAAVLAWLFLQPNPTALLEQKALSVWFVFVALGVLLPSLFLVLAQSVKEVGIVRTDAAQRLSLLIPLMAAFLLFGEPFTWFKAIGLALGLAAIGLIVLKPEAQPQTQTAWLWPGIVFIGTGCIDILFKQMAQLGHIPFADLLFAVFVLAFVLFSLYLAALFAQQKAKWQASNLLGALLLGTFNFGNILFYIKAHQRLAADPALVFASMNIGVIVLGSLVGWWFFKEKLSRLNWLGIGLALAAVACLTLAKL